MKTKIAVLIVSVVATVLIGYSVYSKDNVKPTNAEASEGTLSAKEVFYDFGTISMRDGNVSHQFALTNDGGEPVTIEKVYTSCMCTTAFIIDASGTKSRPFGMPGHGSDSAYTAIIVAPGETIEVEAVYDPNAHGPSGVGLADRLVYVETNSTLKPKTELRFKAMVTK